MRRGWIQLLVCPVIAVAQSQTTPDPAYVRRLLGRIASAVRENIDRLPNYTCNMTVDRYQRAVKSKEPQTMDKVRLEVALVGDHELYAWPGSRHFEERPIRDLVPSGSISTGEFGLLTQSIFLGGVARFQYAGQESLNGHKVHHFLYTVPRAVSKYVVRLPGVQGVVGYAGSAWNDVETLDLVRLEVNFREIPKKLPLSAGHVAIDYERIHVGSGDFLLPRAAEESFTAAGWENSNRTSFSGCREYSTESAISFKVFPSDTTPAPVKESPVVMPAGLQVESKLETELDSTRLATGDPFEAVVTKPVRRKGEVIAPKGAKIHGHISRIVRVDRPYACTAVVLSPEWIGFEGQEGAFDAEEAPSALTEPSLSGRRDTCRPTPEPGTAMLLIHSRSFHVRSGYPVVWQTLKPAGEPRP